MVKQVVQQQELLIQEDEILLAVGGKVVGTDQGQTAIQVKSATNPTSRFGLDLQIM
jgi:hypothetical protein